MARTPVKAEKSEFDLELERVEATVPKKDVKVTETLPQFHAMVRVLDLTTATDFQNLDGEITVKYLRNGWKLLDTKFMRVIDLQDGSTPPQAQILFMFVKE